MRLPVRRSSASTRSGLVSAIKAYLPGAWVTPSKDDLITLYRMRYKMALDEQKFDTALIFLNKILEVEPLDVEAKLNKAEVYHRHLRDYDRAVEQYHKVIRLTPSSDARNTRARNGMTEIMELLS